MQKCTFFVFCEPADDVNNVNIAHAQKHNYASRICQIFADCGGLEKKYVFIALNKYM
jgi:hypothetical protein